MHKFLSELTVKVWLDQVEIGLDNHFSTEELTALDKSIRNSKLIVFFETEDYQEIDHESREPETCFNWQVFEQQFAKEVLIVHTTGHFLPYIISSVVLPDSTKLFFYNLPYLAYFLAIAVDVDTTKLDSYWDKYFAIFPVSTSQIYHVHKFHALAEAVKKRHDITLPEVSWSDEPHRSPAQRYADARMGIFSGRRVGCGPLRAAHQRQEAVRDRQPEHFREARLAEPKKPDIPIAMPSWGLLEIPGRHRRCSCTATECVVHNVLVDLELHSLVINLSFLYFFLPL